MTGVVLQSTLGNETQLACYTQNGTNQLQCALTDLGGATGGEGLFGVLVAGGLMLTFYIASEGGLATPSVLTTLTGGVMIPVLPPEYRTIALTVAFLGLVAALLTGLKKYVMSTGI